jgi:hypothetical protein
MKKQLIIAALAVATSLSAFGQGYVVFSSTKNAGVWYGPSSQSPGSPAALGNNGITVGFMWASQGSVPATGPSGTPTSSSAIVDWGQILTDPLFRFATNSGTGALVTQALNNSGLAQGGWNYNSGVSFGLQGSAPAANLTFRTVAWSSAYANPWEAAAAGSFVGYSNPFAYATGADSSAAVSTFALSGQNVFGVQPIPEPATFALAGLGAAALLIFRRRK